MDYRLLSTNQRVQKTDQFGAISQQGEGEGEGEGGEGGEGEGEEGEGEGEAQAQGGENH